MEIILLERIETLGQMGETVKVKPGYARNYLIPHHKALRATPENKAHFESQRIQLEAKNLEKRQEAETVAAKIRGLKLVIIRQAGDNGQLYGSVTARDIAEALGEAGVTIEKRQVLLDRSLKMIGIYPCRISLHAEVIIDISLNIARSSEEATAQEISGDVKITGSDTPTGQEEPPAGESTTGESTTEQEDQSAAATEEPPAEEPPASHSPVEPPAKPDNA